MKELPEPSVYANINSYDVKLENVHFSYTGEEKGRGCCMELT
ncbi:MAG: hypothetical protein ACLSBD_08255 [Blautia massiliensis (ex Durand et al. 2017)]